MPREFKCCNNKATGSHVCHQMAQQLETKANRMAEYEHKVEQLSHDLSTKEANLVHTKQVRTLSTCVVTTSQVSFTLFKCLAVDQFNVPLKTHIFTDYFDYLHPM